MTILSAVNYSQFSKSDFHVSKRTIIENSKIDQSRESTL